VTECDKRGKNARCFHQGIQEIEDSSKNLGKPAYIAADNLNNPIAKLQFATALLVALGNHNAAAPKIMEKLITEARRATRTDDIARTYHQGVAKETLEPHEARELRDKFLHRSERIGSIVIAMRDRVLPWLEDDVEKLADPAYEKQESGKLNPNISSRITFLSYPPLTEMFRP